MKAIDTDTGFHIKKVFPERNIIFELKVLFKFFRFENKLLLEKISNYRQENNTADDIPDKVGQES
jgi:hypothetical protein